MSTRNALEINGQHDFEHIRRGPVIGEAGKTRVSLYLDNDVLAHFRALASQNKRGCQSEINSVLRDVFEGALVPCKNYSRSLPPAD